MSSAASASPSRTSALRRIIVWVIIGSFGLAAIGGIVVLLGGRLGETAGKVITTTAVVGVASVAVLCCAALMGRRFGWFGLLGVVFAVATLAYTLWFVWGANHIEFTSAQWQALGTGGAVTAAFAFASLLLLLADRRRPVVRAGLWITIALFAVVLALVVFVIWARDYDDTLVQRVLGIFGILAALGAIVVPVMSLLLRDGTDAAASPVSSELSARLGAEAARRGITVEELVAPVLAGSAASATAPAGPHAADA